jgi:hypothetical protein
MIVPRVVNAISGKKIENSAAILREQLYTLTAFVLNVHLQQVKQFHPLRIYVSAVKI